MIQPSRTAFAVAVAAALVLPGLARAQSIAVAHSDEWSVSGYDVDSVRTEGDLRHVTVVNVDTNRARTLFRYSAAPTTIDCRSRTSVLPPGGWHYVLDDPVASFQSDLRLESRWGPEAIMEFEGTEAVAYAVCLDEPPAGRRWAGAEALARQVRDDWPEWSAGGPTPRQRFEARLAGRLRRSPLSPGLQDKLGPGLTDGLGPELR